MKKLNVSEARRILPALVDKVNTTGATLIITRRGRPLAKLVPVDRQEQDDKSLPLRGVPIRVADDFDEPLDEFWEVEES